MRNAAAACKKSISLSKPRRIWCGYSTEIAQALSEEALLHTTKAVSRLAAAITIATPVLLCSCSSNPIGSFVRIAGSTTVIQKPGVSSVAASCSATEQLVGGGYLLDGDFALQTKSGQVLPVAPPVSVTENYPSSMDTWTVTADSSTATSSIDAKLIAGTALTAIAYCFTTPNVKLRMTPSSATATTVSTPSSLISSGSAFAKCPAGSVLTGGGFRVVSVNLQNGFDKNIANSFISGEGPFTAPSGKVSGWRVQLTTPNTVTESATSYALCAGNYFATGSVISQPVGVSNLPAQNISADAVCPSGTFTTGGGYVSSVQLPSAPYLFYSSYFSSAKQPGILRKPLSSWQSKIYMSFGGATISETAYCIPLPS